MPTGSDLTAWLDEPVNAREQMKLDYEYDEAVARGEIKPEGVGFVLGAMAVLLCIFISPLLLVEDLKRIAATMRRRLSKRKPNKK